MKVVFDPVINSWWVKNFKNEIINGPFNTSQEAQLCLVKLQLSRKNKEESPPTKLEIDPNESTYLRLRILVNGILSGDVKPGLVSEKAVEVLTSFEAFLSAKGRMTEKQLKCCKDLLFKYKDIITSLIKEGKIPMPDTRPVSVQKAEALKPGYGKPIEDHRKYERIADLEEPKKSTPRERLIKKEEDK